MTDQSLERHEDFLTKLRRLIDEGYQTEAVAEILALEDIGQRFVILEQLLPEEDRSLMSLRLELSLAGQFSKLMGITSKLARDLDFVGKLANGLAGVLTHALKSECRLDRARALLFARHHALDFSLHPHHLLPLELVSSLALELVPLSGHGSYMERVSFLSKSLILLLESSFISYQVETEVANYRSQSLANAFDECLYFQPSAVLETVAAVLREMIGADLRHFTLEGLTAITPDALAYQIAPYLQAIRDTDQIRFEMNQQTPYGDFRIMQIHNKSAKIEIGVGAADTLWALNNMLSREKRQQESGQRELQNEKQRLENERYEMETAIHLQRLALDQDKRLAAQERAMLQEELRQKKLETHTKELELEERRWKLEEARMDRYFALAMEMLQKFTTNNLSTEQLIDYLPRMVRSIKTVIESDLTMRIGWHNAPRTLPEHRGD